MMAFMLKSKVAMLKIRDGMNVGDKILDVGPTAWVRFESMPNGLTLKGNQDVEVKEIADDEQKEEQEDEQIQGETKHKYRRRG